MATEPSTWESSKSLLWQVKKETGENFWNVSYQLDIKGPSVGGEEDFDHRSQQIHQNRTDVMQGEFLCESRLAGGLH